MGCTTIEPTTDLATLYLAERSRMIGYACERVGCMLTAQDIVQDTFVRLCNVLADGRQIEHLSGYAWTTLRNTIVDWVRKDKFRVHSAIEPEHWTTDTDAHRVEIAADFARLWQQVDLTDDQREALRLHALGYSWRETTEQMQYSNTEALKAIVHRARVKLAGRNVATSHVWSA